MSFLIPNDVAGGTAEQHAQASPDAGDIAILVDALAGNGVVSGCAVTQGTGMAPNVASGTVQVGGVAANVTGGTVTVTTADATNPRFDLVVVNSSGTKSVTAGTASATPVFPAIPATSVVLAAIYVAAGVTSIVTADIIDKRAIIGSAVLLTADVSGILPTANGGTGIAYFTAAGPTAARVYTFPDAAATILYSGATGVQTFLTTPSSANLAAALTDETGSGAAVFDTSPTITNITMSKSATFNFVGATGATQYGILMGASMPASVGTTETNAFYTQIGLTSGAYTDVYNMHIINPGIGTATIATLYGLRIGTLNKATTNWGLYVDTNNNYFGGNVGIGMIPTYQLQLSTDSAAKPTTNTWTIASDANMKDASKQRPYERGLDLIRALPTPHYWTYNGKADTPEGVESMGWNAQDLEVIAPKMVRKTRGKLTPAREKRVNEKGDVELVPVPKEIVDALPETDLLGINTHELTYAMFNAIRELDASVKALEKKPH